MTKTTTTTTNTTSTKKADKIIGFSAYTLKRELHACMLVYHHFKLINSYILPVYSERIKNLKAMLETEDISPEEREVALKETAHLTNVKKAVAKDYKNVIKNIAKITNMNKLYVHYKNKLTLDTATIREWITSICDLQEGQTVKFGNDAEKQLVGYIQGAIGTCESKAKSFTEKGNYAGIASEVKFYGNVCAALVEYYNNTKIGLASKYANSKNEYQLTFSYEVEKDTATGNAGIVDDTALDNFNAATETVTVTIATPEQMREFNALQITIKEEHDKEVKSK